MADEEQAHNQAQEEPQTSQDRAREERRKRREAWGAANLARQAAVVDDLASRAADPAGWAALRRQAASYLRHLETWRVGRGFEGIRPALEAHREHLERAVAEAGSHLAALPPDERHAAECAVGLRLAIIGKGGAGKTVISSTLARLLARRGRQVLVADLDTNPGLSYSIGLKGADITLPAEAVEADPGAAYGWQLRSDLLPRHVVERYTVPGPDGVAVMGLGKIGEPEKEAAKHTVVALIQVLLGFGEPGWDVIGDLEAGPTTPFERYHAFAEHVAVVVGPAWRSAMTARRLLPMVGEGRTTTIVANRFRDEPDHPGLAPHVRIPFDPDVAEAERRGLSPLDECPDSPTIRAVADLVDYFLAQEVNA
jgi:CO dehydrogenase maturation factor